MKKKKLRKAIWKELAKYDVSKRELKRILRELKNLNTPVDFPFPVAKALRSFIDDCSRSISQTAASQGDNKAEEFPFVVDTLPGKCKNDQTSEETGKSTKAQPKVKSKDKFMVKGPDTTDRTPCIPSTEELQNWGLRDGQPVILDGAPDNSAGTSIEETGKSADFQPKTKPKDEFMFKGPVITTDTKKHFASICNDETSNHAENCSGTEKQTSEDTSTMTVDGNNCPSKESIIKTVEEIINEMLYKAADNMDELRSILMNNTDAVYTNYIVKYFGFESITCYNASVAHTLDSHKQKDIMQIYGTVICQTSYTCNNSEFAIANRRKYKMGVFVCYNNKTDDYMVVVYTSNTPNVSGMHPYQPADLIMIIHRVLQVTRTADIWSQIRTVQLRAVKHVPTKEDIIADPTNPFGFTSSFEYTLASFRVTPVKDKDTDK